MKCSIKSCQTRSRKRGFCPKHYMNWRRSDSNPVKCSVNGCGKGMFGNGFCQQHNIRYKLHGSPDICLTLYGKTPEERYHLGYEKRGKDECWPWIKGQHRGYGRLPLKRTTVSAHRFGWELLNGTIPVGFFVCHKCDNPPCQNPRHWFIGTPKDNTEDMVKKGRLKTNPYKDSRGRFTTA